MSVYASPATQSGEQEPPAIAAANDRDTVPDEYRRRYQQAKIERRRFEPVWQLCQSFLQNRQWVGWNYHERRIVELPNPDDRVRVTVNVLTQYLWTFLGKLSADDFMPDIRFRRDDQVSQGFARQTRRRMEYGWEEEWDADEKILEALLYMGAFGLGGLRARFDPTLGEPVAQFPRDAQGSLHIEDMHSFMADNMGSGAPADMHTLHEGALVLDPLSPFNILPPPGIFHERDFPWLFIERPVAIDALEAVYPRAKGLTEETMRAIDMIGVREDTMIAPGLSQSSGTLKGHVMLKTGFKFPTAKQPLGEQIVFAGHRLLDGPKPLPFQSKGRGMAGLCLYKYHPVPGRFWPMGVIEPGIGPQKQRNRARSQWIEMKDRAGLGRVFATRGSVSSVTKPKGGVFELVEVLPGHDFPKETQGVAPGPWLQAEVAQDDADLKAVMGLQDVSLGQAPAGVSAYSAFALLAEQDDRRMGPVLKHVRLETAKLMKVLIAGVRQYDWPGKEIPIVGDNPDDLLDSFIYDSTKLPAEVFVQIGKGAPLPQSEAAEAQKIFDIFDRSISSGQALPLSWLVDSLKDRKAQPIPESDGDMQLKAAELENNLMVHGQQVQVNEWDNDELHVQRHRLAQGALTFNPEMQPLVQLIEEHIQQHLQSAQGKNAMAQPTGGLGMQGAPPTNPGGFGALGGTGGLAGAQGKQDVSAMRADARFGRIANTLTPAAPNVRPGL